MTKKPENPPAFPKAANVNAVTISEQQQQGMTLRDWFAGMALQGMLAGRQNTASNDFVADADECYLFADAMLKARGDE